uniref:Maturase K n=1 Tax=Romanomermis culicivorax TaxID=13658 RepID=A0A915HLF3_ROMCU
MLKKNKIRTREKDSVEISHRYFRHIFEQNIEDYFLRIYSQVSDYQPGNFQMSDSRSSEFPNERILN